MLGMRALSTNRIIDLNNFVKRIVRIHNNRRSTSTQIKYLIDLIQCKHPPTNKWGKTRCTDSKRMNGQLDVTVEVHIYSSRNRFNLVHESTTFNRPLTHYIYTILIWFGKNFNQIQSHHQQPSAQHTNEIPLNSKLIAVINFKFRAQLAHSHSWRSVNTVRPSSHTTGVAFKPICKFELIFVLVSLCSALVFTHVEIHSMWCAKCQIAILCDARAAFVWRIEKVPGCSVFVSRIRNGKVVRLLSLPQPQLGLTSVRVCVCANTLSNTFN